MAFIDNNWKRYFDDLDEGIGTTYERFILNRHFEKITEMFPITNILEVPSFGMTGISGINSLWWAKRGCGVTVVDDDRERIEKMQKIWRRIGLEAHFVLSEHGRPHLPFRDNSFDMSWNFASMQTVFDIRGFISDLTRITRKCILVCIQNERNLGRRVFGRILNIEKKERVDMGMDVLCISAMQEKGWIVHESGYFDVPPWPDIAMKKEDILRKIRFCKLASFLERQAGNHISILEYFNGKDINMEKRIMRWSFLEDIPRPLKKRWAHHKYFVFVPA